MTKQLLSALIAVLPAAHAQLHLITGTPLSNSSRRFPSELLLVGDDGEVRAVADLAPQPPGAAWITVSYDLGIALIQSDRMVVLDLGKAQVVKSCPFVPGPAHTVWVYRWLLSMPSRRGVLAEEFAHSEDKGSLLRGTLIDPKVACGNSYVSLEPADLRYVAAHGSPLIASLGDYDAGGLYTHLGASGELLESRSGLQFSYGYTVPPEQLAGLKRPYAGIAVSNSEILVLGISDGGRGPDYRDLALRKRDNTWHRVPLPAVPWKPDGQPPVAGVRGFGHFVAMAEVRPKDAQNPESAGSGEWMEGQRKTGLDQAAIFRLAKVVFPGLLHLYDVDTDRSYTISTNQGDSEIVLVENNVVYYRVSDRLYSVPITGNGLGESHLIAKDDAIRDAHWAFLAR
jgi:hypothetical protein